jgi:hypothetical protein
LIGANRYVTHRAPVAAALRQDVRIAARWLMDKAASYNDF